MRMIPVDVKSLAHRGLCVVLSVCMSLGSVPARAYAEAVDDLGAETVELVLDDEDEEQVPEVAGDVLAADPGDASSEDGQEVDEPLDGDDSQEPLPETPDVPEDESVDGTFEELAQEQLDDELVNDEASDPDDGEPIDTEEPDAADEEPGLPLTAQATIAVTGQTVSLGENHSAAIKADGSLWTWGANSEGQLGDRTITSCSTPVKIMDDVVAVSLGTYHSAALKTDGSLWVWGCNDNGQIGDGTTRGRYSPVKVMDGVAAVSLCGFRSAAIKADGSLWTWGKNSLGQLGDGTTTDRREPVKVMDGVAAVSLCGSRSAAIKADGSLWTWGNNSLGQLGDGTTEDLHEPVKVMSGVAAVSLGGSHSAAIKADGSLWTWGNNSRGQLGDGTTEDRHEPVKVMSGVAAVSLGTHHSAARKADESLWTWGSNVCGILGDGTTEDRAVPVKIMDDGSGPHYPAGYDFLDDSYSFGNFVALIPLGYWRTMYEEGSAKLFFRQSVQGGVCFGMAFTTASILNNAPSVTEFELGGTPAQRIRDLRLSTMTSSQLGVSDGSRVRLSESSLLPIDSFIKYAHIYQFSTEEQDGYFFGSDEPNTPEALLEYTKSAVDEDDSLSVTVGMRCEAKGHRVLAVGYEGNAILVDDPNNAEGLERIVVDADGSWSYSGKGGATAAIRPAP